MTHTRAQAAASAILFAQCDDDNQVFCLNRSLEKYYFWTDGERPKIDIELSTKKATALGFSLGCLVSSNAASWLKGL